MISSSSLAEPVSPLRSIDEFSRRSWNSFISGDCVFDSGSRSVGEGSSKGCEGSATWSGTPSNIEEQHRREEESVCASPTSSGVSNTSLTCRGSSIAIAETGNEMRIVQSGSTVSDSIHTHPLPRPVMRIAYNVVMVGDCTDRSVLDHRHW